MTQTPYESSSGAITSVATETTWVNAMVAANPTKVTKQVVGLSPTGKDVYILRFGSGSGRPVVVGTGVHGDENAPREAVFALIRDLCETAHPWTTMLTQRQIIVVPTINPDGQPNDRNNATGGGGVNVNRSYTTLPATAPEAIGLSSFYYSVDPIAIYDGHEWLLYGAGRTYEVGSTTKADVDRGLWTECIALGNAVKAAVVSAAAANSWTFDIAPNWYDLDTPAGALTDWTGDVGIFGLVVETMAPLAYIGTERPKRVAQHSLSMTTFLNYVSTNMTNLLAVSTAARARMAARVGRTDTAWYLDLHVRINGQAQQTSSPSVSAVAYDIAPADVATAAAVLDAHGITRSGGHVSLAQEKAPLIVSLLDPLADSTGRLPVTATRVAPDPVTYTAPTAAYQLWSHVTTH